MDHQYSARAQKQDGAQHEKYTNHPTTSNQAAKVMASVPRSRHANFARPIARPPLSSTSSSTHVSGLRPPVAFDSYRDSLSSVYSQSSNAESPNLPARPIAARKVSARLIHTRKPSDLSSINEMDDRYAPVGLALPSKKTGNHPQPLSGLSRQASVDKPLVSPITRSNSQWSSKSPVSQFSPRESTARGGISRSDTITALTSAISANIRGSTSTVQTVLPVNSAPAPRMPFDESPRSGLISEDDKSLHSLDSDQGPLASLPTYQHNDSTERLTPPRTYPGDSSPSSLSTNALLPSPSDQTTTSMSDKIPPSKRPPNLNLNAVREAEARGSLTSLPDLIQRATRLASNLDRGKTASRLGLEHMFSSSDKASSKKRESTYSDVLFSFPAPGFSRPGSAAQEHRSSQHVGNEKSIGPSHSRLAEIKEDVDEVRDAEKKARRRKHRSKRKRRCCGMSMTVFIVVLVLMVILVAASILLPIFLIWMPKQNATSPGSARCSADFPCQNNGVSVMDNNACSCVCTGGFWGKRCANIVESDCTMRTLQDGNTVYTNATAGNDVVPLLLGASSMFGVELNSTTLLSIFSGENLSCAGENSLVKFDINGPSKRFVILPGVDLNTVPDVPKDGFSNPLSTFSSLRALTTAHVVRRQESGKVASTNNIVYAETTQIPTPSSSSSAPSADATSSVPAITTATPTTPSASSPTSSSNGSGSSKLTSTQIDFARVVVLYVLQQTREPSMAVNAQQLLKQFLDGGGPNGATRTVDVLGSGLGDNRITADFGNYSISSGNGVTVGGTRHS